MRPAHPAELTPDGRRAEVATILAAGLARLLRARLSPPNSAPAESAPNPTSALALPAEKSVTVPTVDPRRERRPDHEFFGGRHGPEPGQRASGPAAAHRGAAARALHRGLR
jgi:hypothetical protein